MQSEHETDDVAWEALIDAQQDEVSKAFVALTIYMPFLEEGKQFAVASAWVFEVKGQWILVTAEHVFLGHEDSIGLDELIDKHPETVVQLQPFHAGKDAGTLFNIRQSNRFTTRQLAEAWQETLDPKVRQIMSEADLLVYPLSQYYEDHLKAVGVVPLTYEQVGVTTFDEASEKLQGKTVTARLFGVPKATVKSDTEKASAWLMRLPVAPVGEEPPYTFWEPTWNATEIPHDVRGTSGGPIVLLGADRPYVMGIQVAQVRIKRKLRLKAVTGYAFFHFVASWVRYAREQESGQ